MTIIVFLLDTSASMNQRVFLGGRPTLLDVAKSAVETFVKVRQRSLDSRQDRYMLLTFEEPPSNIKAGWKENLGTFMSELKNLQANGLTTLGHALRHTFDVLNVNRMQHGIDTYGQGRCPFYLEPSIIVAITDGGRLSSNSGVQDELKMHGSSPGFELTREPFRWDQRLFSLVLRMSGQPAGDTRETGLVPSDTSPIDAMCEVTGGRSYCITSHRMLHQCIDSLVQKVQAGVVMHFEKIGADPPPIITVEGKTDDTDLDILEDKNDSKMSWHNSRKMIYVPRTNQKGFAGGFWPIPESFWPDTSMVSLPPRSAHPHVKFTCIDREPLVIENFPFDKYELEPSPLTQYILARKQPSVCWQAYIGNGSKNGQLSQPFGYLKASTNLTVVNLFVMPHNYPILLPLLDDLFRIYRLKPTNEWRQQFGIYVSSMPAYYAGPLKRALIRMGAGVIAQSINEETFLSYSVLNYLKKLKTQAKVEFERTCSEVGARVKLNESKQRTFTSYKNPFDVPRHQLLDHIAKLRTSILRPKPTSDLQQELLHSMPVGQMGNYQEYLKRMPTPLREIESTPVRQHMFGNPFKIDKRMIIDEADMPLDIVGQQSKNAKKEQALAAAQNQMPLSNNNNNNNNLPRVAKRKPGPLPRDYSFTPKIRRRDSTSSIDSNSSSITLDTPPSSPFSPINIKEELPINDSYSPSIPVIPNFTSFYSSSSSNNNNINNKDNEGVKEKDSYEFHETKITTPNMKNIKHPVPDNDTPPMEIGNSNIFSSSDSSIKSKSNVKEKKNNNLLHSIEESSESRPNNSYLGSNYASLYEDYLDVEDDDDDDENIDEENDNLLQEQVSTKSNKQSSLEEQKDIEIEKDNLTHKKQQSETDTLEPKYSENISKTGVSSNNNNNNLVIGSMKTSQQRTNVVVPVNGEINLVQQQYSFGEQNNLFSTPLLSPNITLSASGSSSSVHSSSVPVSPRTNGLSRPDVINNHVSPLVPSPSSSSSNPISSSSVPELTLNHISNNIKSNKKRPSEKIVDSKLSATSHTKNVPKLDDEVIRQQNFKLRTQLYAEIRRPVFRQDVFLSKLKEIVGPPEVQTEFLRGLEREALRFKRKRIVEILTTNFS